MVHLDAAETLEDRAVIKACLAMSFASLGGDAGYCVQTTTKVVSNFCACSLVCKNGLSTDLRRSTRILVNQGLATA